MTFLTLMALALTITGFILTVTISKNIGFQVTADYSKRTIFAGSETGYPFFCDIVITPSHPWWNRGRQSSTLITNDQLNQINEIHGYNWSEPYIGDINIIFEKVTNIDGTNGKIMKEWNVRDKNGTNRSFSSNIWLAGLDYDIEEVRLRNKVLVMEGKNFNDLQDGIAIGYDFAKQNDIHVGDTIIIPADNLGVHGRPGKAFLKTEEFRGVWEIIVRIRENPWNENFSFNLENTLTLKVESIFWTATPYDNFIITDYNFLQEALSFNDRMTCILLGLNKETDTNEFLNGIWSIEGVDAYIPTIRKQYIRGSDVQVAQTFSGISPSRFTEVSNWQTIIVSGFSTATFMASTFYTILYRRRGEIGLLKSIGFESSFIIMMLLIEPFILGLFAGLTGFILAYLISALSMGVYIPFLGYIPLLSSFIPQIEIKPIFAWGVISITISILISIISSFLPAYTASRLTPVEAMRGNTN